jgi:hypothetical protein
MSYTGNPRDPHEWIDDPKPLGAAPDFGPEPTVGRVVHYQSYGTPGGEYLPEPRAAMITQVALPEKDKPRSVGLMVVNPTGVFFKEDIPYAEQPTPGHWNWPPRA